MCIDGKTLRSIFVRTSREMRIYRVIRNDCRGFNICHLILQMQPHAISFYGVTSRVRFIFLLFPQVCRNWRYESEPPLKPSPLTCGTNSIIVLMFVESQRFTYRAPVRYVTKTWSVVLLNKKHIYSYLKSVVYDKLLKPRQSFRITLYIYCQKQSRTSGSHGKWLWRIFSSGMWENVKLKQSLQAWKSPDGSQIWTQSSHGRGKVVSSTHRPPWPPGSNGTNFC